MIEFFQKLFRRKKKLSRVTPAEIRVEEKRLEIRENQSIAELDKIDKEREEIFHQGAKTTSAARRRIYARRFTMLSQKAKILEREVLRYGKELITVGRLRAILERERGGGGNLLEKLSDEDLVKVASMLEDDKITEAVYMEKLDGVLGVVNDPALQQEEIGQEGMEVLKTWEQMDEGGIDFDTGLKEAAGGTKEKEPDPPQGEPA